MLQEIDWAALKTCIESDSLEDLDISKVKVAIGKLRILANALRCVRHVCAHCPRSCLARRNNSSVRTIRLSSNNIDADGCQVLAEALSDHIAINEVVLNNNKIGSAGCTAIAECLRANFGIKSLDVRHL